MADLDVVGCCDGGGDNWKTDCVHVGLRNGEIGEIRILEEAVEVVEDDKKSHIVVMENVEGYASAVSQFVEGSVDETVKSEHENGDVCLTEVGCDEGVNKSNGGIEEVVMGSGNTESVGTDVEIRILKEIDEVLSPEDDAVQAVLLETEATDDPVIDVSAVSQFVEDSVDETVKSEQENGDVCLTEVGCGDGVLKSDGEIGEVIIETYDVKEVNGLDNTESVGADVELQKLKEVVEVLRPEDDAVQPVSLETEAIGDPVIDARAVSQFVEDSVDETETETSIQLKGSAENIEVSTVTEVGCDDGVLKSNDEIGEVIIETYDVEEVNGFDNTESVGADEEHQTLKEIVEVIEDDKKFEAVVIENVEVLSPEDDASESVNETEPPLETEVTDVVMENSEVFSADDDAAESVNEAEPSVETEVTDAVMENVEVLSADDDATQSVNEAEPPLGTETTDVVMENIEVLSTDDDATQSVNGAEPPLVTEATDVVMENAEVLSTDDDVTQSANETEPPLDTETTEDPIMSVSSVSQYAEDGFGSVDETETSIQLNGNAENIEVSPAAESVKSEHLNDTDYRTEVETCDDGEQTQFEVKEAPVMDQLIVTFPATFVTFDINIQFGSFGRTGDTSSVLKDLNPETETECVANINNRSPIPIDVQENDKSVTCEGVDGIDDGQGDGETEEVELTEQIKKAQLQLDEKRRCKDTILDEIHIKQETIIVHNKALNSKNLELRTAKQLVNSKRQQINDVERAINRVKNVIAVEDIDNRINKAEHMIEHKALCTEDEKQFIHEIKQLKIMRVQLASNMGIPVEIQNALDQKDQLEELLKDLNTELRTLKNEVSKAQGASNTLRKKYTEEREMESELRAQFIAAKESCKEASAHLRSLERRLSDEVERFMDEWDADEEFSMHNILATPSTQEEPSHVFLNDTEQQVASDSGPTPDDTEQQVASDSGPTPDDTDQKVDSYWGPAPGDTDQKIASDSGPDPDDTDQKIASDSGPAPYDMDLEDIKEKEKTDELMKEEMEAKLKEKIMLEEKKANEAQERKKRNAEKAQMRAEKRAHQEAQQEAQEKEKRRLKRLKKREKKRASLEKKRAVRDAASSSSNISIDDGVVAELDISGTIPPPPAVTAAIRNKNRWRHSGNMAITFVVLILSVLTLLHSSDGSKNKYIF